MTDCDFLCILMPACFIVVQLLSDSFQIHGYDEVYSPREAVICYVRVNAGYMGTLQKNKYNELFPTKTAKVNS